MRTNTRGAALAALCASVLLTTAACGGGGSAEGGDANTITWWHNSNNQPGKGYYEQVAKDFEADKNTRPARYYRWWNEVPTVLMIAIVFLAVLKPS